MAFGAGVLLLAFVLFVPALEGLFLVAPVTGFQLLCIIGLAFAAHPADPAVPRGSRQVILSRIAQRRAAAPMGAAAFFVRMYKILYNFLGKTSLATAVVPSHVDW